MSLCCLLFGTARAQISAVSEISEEGVYVINWNRTNYGGLNAFMVSSNTATTVTNSRKASGVTYTHDNDTDPKYQFAIIHGATEGQYFLYSISANKFVKNATSSKELSLTDSPNTAQDYVTFDPHTTSIGSTSDPCGFSDKMFHIIFGSNSARININGSGQFNLLTAAAATDDPGNVFQIVAVSGASFTGEVAENARQKVNPTKAYTLNYVYNGETLKTETINARPFAALSVTVSDYTINNYTCGGTEITEYPASNETAISVNVTPNFPFWTDKVYKIHPRDNSYLLGAVGTAQPSIVADDTFNPSNWWYFVRKPETLNSFSIRTFYMQNYGITSAVNSSSTAAKVAPTVSATPTDFNISMVSGSTTQFIVQDPTKTTYYLGGHDSWNSTLGKNTKLTAWNGSGASTDGGSKFTVEEISWESLKTLQDAMGNDVSFAHIADLDSRTDAPTLSNIVTAINNATPIFETGKNYLIYSGLSGSTDKTITADPIGTKDGNPQDNNRNLSFSNTAVPVKSMVQFEAVEGETNKYYIKNVNSGMYYGQLSSSQQAMLPVSKDYAGKYTPLYEGSGDFTLLGLKETTSNQYIHNASNKMVGWTGKSTMSAGSSIRIKPCESLEVALSAAGWSTYCSPVALTIPEVEGLHIYYVSSNQADAVYVKEITGTIPAKTPVLINGAASTTITFAIAEDVTAIEGNKLLGTTMRRNGFSTDTSNNPDVYGLKISETTASFVPAYSATLPANKAVLPYENIDFSGMTGEAATNAFRLVIDEEGTTTGIAAAPVRHAGDNGLLRDLSGRVVAYPIAGQVYIKSNGQKIILK